MIGPLAVLLVASAVGVGVRAVRSWKAEAALRTELQHPVQHSQPESLPSAPKTPQLETVAGAPSAPATDDAPIAEAPAPIPETEPQEQAEPGETAHTVIVEDGPPDMAGLGGWREVWADLNLTAEEQARLREGFRLAWERWQNMSEEERQAERARWQAMRERWDNMSESERRQASQRMRDRFEQWRRSGEVELPELTLD